MLGDFKRFYRAMRVKAAQGNMNAKPEAVAVPVPATGAQIVDALRNAFNNSMDFQLLIFGNNTVMLAYLEGMVDKLLISQYLIEPVKANLAEMETNKALGDKCAFLADKLNVACPIELLTDFDNCINDLLSGKTLVFVDGGTVGISLGLRKFERRNVEQSQSEVVTRGSREAFTEVLITNVTLLRRIVKDSTLVFENTIIGRQTKTNVTIGYIKGLANQGIIDEVRKRLRNISTEEIIESGYVEEYIEDAPFSIFPTVYYSERPSTVAAKLLEGRIAILCDGTPVVLTVPNLFIDYFQFADDYINRWIPATLIRIIRLFAFWIATMLPAYYIALLCFHQDVIPFKLLITISNSLNQIPFPPLIEMLALTILFEIIRESGLRMPMALGQAVSVVGGLIVGQAAVQAGLFSTSGVVAVAATSISTFIISKLDTPILIIRIFMMVAANTLGLLGVLLGSIAIFIHLCSLKSFGVPYLSPITPVSGNDLKDAFIRVPLWALLSKPETITRRYVNTGDK